MKMSSNFTSAEPMSKNLYASFGRMDTASFSGTPASIGRKSFHLNVSQFNPEKSDGDDQSKILVSTKRNFPSETSEEENLKD
jgi:hypothetical protein